MRKQLLGNRGLQIFCKCQILPLTPASRSCRVILLKGLISPYMIPSRASKYENIL